MILEEEFSDVSASATDPLELMAAQLAVLTKSVATLARTIDIALTTKRLRGPLAVIGEEVSRFYGIPLGAIRGQRRHRPLVDARHVAIWLSAELTDLSLTRLGLYWRRDHTTIMHAIRAVRGWESAGDPRFADATALRAALEGSIPAALGVD